MSFQHQPIKKTNSVFTLPVDTKNIKHQKNPHTPSFFDVLRQLNNPFSEKTCVFPTTTQLTLFATAFLTRPEEQHVFAQNTYKKSTTHLQKRSTKKNIVTRKINKKTHRFATRQILDNWLTHKKHMKN